MNHIPANVPADRLLKLGGFTLCEDDLNLAVVASCIRIKNTGQVPVLLDGLDHLDPGEVLEFAGEGDDIVGHTFKVEFLDDDTGDRPPQRDNRVHSGRHLTIRTIGKTY